MAGTKRRSMRQTAIRRRSVYLDPETDDDFEADSEDEYQPAESVEVAQEPATKKRKASSRRRPQTRSKAAKTRQTTLKRVFKIGKARQPNEEPVKKVYAGPSDGKIPKWTSLPHAILKQIFTYAAGDTQAWVRASHDNAAWLKLSAARVCRAFAVPALEAFYQSPGIYNTQYPHQLLELLCTPDDQRYINYNVKVHKLNIDLRNLAYTAPGRPVFDLLQLVPKLPQLQHMELLHQNYEKPYRPRKQPKWTIQPLELVHAMEEAGIHLRTWRWSRDTIPKSALTSNVSLDLYEKLSTAHDSSVFSYLTRLVVTGFNVDDSLEPATAELPDQSGDMAALPGLATSIAKLPSLTDLTFVSCDIIMEQFLQRLPTNLQRLELSNCLEITSDMLREFFATSGSQLKELELNNNAALNLSFTQSLREKCPRLETLKMDLQLYSERETTNDAFELYDELLPAGETATWPSTLRYLEILEAPNKWSPESAQNFFRTLVEHADELPDLRTLIIHAHIDIPWRDRVGFRDQWIERLRRVYERPHAEPNTQFGSLKQFRMSRQDHADKPKLYSSDLDELSRDLSDDDRPLRRRVAHVQISPHKPSIDTVYFSESDATSEPRTTRPQRRSKRVAESQTATRPKTETPSQESASESEDEDDSAAEDWRKTPEKFVQGLCDLVDIRIDNQRPRETQWREADFLDAEASGDDDWNEDAEEEEEGYAW